MGCRGFKEEVTFALHPEDKWEFSRLGRFKGSWSLGYVVTEKPAAVGKDAHV